jgi:bacteriorhodopsin
MNKLRVYPKKLFWRLYWVVLALSLILDLVWLYLHSFHYHFQFQYLPQFFAILGLFGCMLLILIAKALGIIIVVDEDYYQKKSR